MNQKAHVASTFNYLVESEELRQVTAVTYTVDVPVSRKRRKIET